MSQQQTKIKKQKDWNKKLEKPKWTFISILIGFLIGFIVLAIAGYNPFDFLYTMFDASLGSVAGLGNFIGMLAWTIPLGLAMAVSFRAGYFNIGAAGQMMLGGMVAYLVAFEMPNTSIIGWFPPLACGVIVAMFLGMIIAFLKNKFNINEVLSSIMFNWMVFWGYKALGNPSYSAKYLTQTHGFKPLTNAAGGIGHTENTLFNEGLSNLFNGADKMTGGIFLAIIAVILIWFLFKYTSFGFKLDVAGSNPEASKYAGENPKAKTIETLALSAALAGLAGVIYFTGFKSAMPKADMNEIPSQGFEGITISLIAWNSPLGILGGAALIGMLENCGLGLQAIGISTGITSIVTSLIIFSIAISQYFIIYNPIEKWKKKRKLEKEGDG